MEGLGVLRAGLSDPIRDASNNVRLGVVDRILDMILQRLTECSPNAVSE